MMMCLSKARGRDFHIAEDGITTPVYLLLFVVFVMIGGIGLDVANAYKNRTHLQVAADSAAHAALYAREFRMPEEAKLIALDVAEKSLPREKFGETLRETDILFGYWDAASETFTPDPGATQAVLIATARIEERFNAVPTYLLRMIGLNAWNVRRQSVFETYKPTCLREGFVGEDVVSVTTGNTYESGFCVHSNTHVSLNNDNTFQPRSIVSMPDRRDIVLPAGGMSTNPGLAAALRDGSYKLRIVQRINDIIEGIQTPGSPYYRRYITSSVPIALNRNDKLDSTTFISGRIHTITCTSATQQAKIHAATVLKEVVIVTNCQLMFGENVVLEDVVIGSKNTSSKSISAASGLQLGRNDNCAPNGDAQLVTLGGVDIPQYLKMFGSQILAVGDVSFTSDANGVQGASIVSGGRIDGTTDSTMGFCGGAGMENNFEAWYFRLAA
jgi:hypothetical protein